MCLKRERFDGSCRPSVVGLFESNMGSSESKRSSLSPTSSYLVGFLRSTDITPLPRYYEPRRLPTRARRKVIHSPSPLHPQMHPVGSPRFLAVRSTRAVPTHPGEYAWCTCSLLPRRWQASPSLAGWPLSKQRNEAESGSLLTAHVFAFRGFERRITPPPAPSAT